MANCPPYKHYFRWILLSVIQIKNMYYWQQLLWLKDGIEHKRLDPLTTYEKIDIVDGQLDGKIREFTLGTKNYYIDYSLQGNFQKIE